MPTEIEPCPFPECDGKCSLQKTCHSDDPLYWIGCSGCTYHSLTSVYSEEAIAAHNALSLTVQRARQLESRLVYYEDPKNALEYIEFDVDCSCCDDAHKVKILSGHINGLACHIEQLERFAKLAVLAEFTEHYFDELDWSAFETLKDVYVDEAINPDDKEGGSNDS